MRVTCERCLRRYDVPDATVRGRKIRARCKCGARVVVQDEERAARSSAGGSQTTGSIHRPVRWFVDITSWEPIAMDLRQLVRAFDGGRIDADTLVWRKGMPDWRRLRDVSELAERLMGADAGAKAAAPEVAPEAMPSESELPPRQVERSKTPPANYSVNDRPSMADAREAAAPVQELQHSLPPSVAPGAAPSEPEATLRGASSVPPPPVKSHSTTPPRARARGERASVPGARAVPMPGGNSLPVKAEVRTITQTGLAPADPTQRASVSPGASEARAEGAAAGAANARNRDSRVPTPAGGQRRARSSDETPAQKPSSISVPPGSMSQSPPRPRGKHVVAVAVLVLALGFLVRGTLSTDGSGSSTAATAVGSHPKPSVAEAAPPREERAPEPITEPVKFNPEPSPSVAPALAPAEAPAPKAAERSVSTPPAPPAAAAKPAVAPVPVSPPPQPQKPPAAVPAVAATTPRLEVRPSQPAPVEQSPSAAPARTVTGQPEPAPSTPAPAPTPEPPAAAAPAAPAAPLPPATPPSAAEPPASAPSTVPGPFDEKLARQQMAVAAFKASTCGQLGETRGAGEVRVVIESWGRVVRVTHLNQAYVGTPVGLCVMQAFQQVQVPPFAGSPQSVSGTFLIQ